MLTSLHLVVEVGIDTSIVFVLLVVLIFVVLLHTLATQPLEEVGHLLIVQGVVEVLRHALETSETSVAILRTIADIRTGAYRVGLIGIGGEDGIQREGVALRQLQAQTRGEVAPRAHISSHVIGHRGAQLVNDADFLEACRVVVGLDFHLDIIRDIHRDASRLTLSRTSENGTLEHAILYHRHIAVLIGLLIDIPEAIARRAEVGRIAETDRRREDVAHSLYLIAEYLARRDIEAIELGRCAQTEVPVVVVVEALQGIYNLALVDFIP